jgi:hypothetical protein
MRMIHLFTLAVLALATLHGLAAPVTLTRTVLQPDGKPAVGAAVFIRQYTLADNTVKESKLTTDAQGQFSIALEPNPTQPDLPPFVDVNDGYFLIDMPGYALHVALYNLQREQRQAGGAPPPGTVAPPNGLQAPFGGLGGGLTGGGDTKTVRLAAAFEITGVVSDLEKKPVADARVFAVGLTNGHYGPRIPLNVPGVGIMTLALATKSGADGSYRLRGLTATFSSGGPTMGMPTMAGGPVPVALVALSADGTRVGEVENGIFTRPESLRADMATRNNLTLSPTVSLEGRITNAATGAPAANVQVRLRSRPSVYLGCLAPAVTDKDGRYRFASIPAYVTRLYTICTAKEMADGWACAYDQRRPVEKPLTNVNMTVRPWVDVKGTLKDETTTQKPVVPIHITAIYDEGLGQDGDFGSLGRQACGCESNADGTFMLHIPVGSATLRIGGAGYGSSDFIPVEPKNNPPLQLTVKRLPGIVVRFVSTRQID